MEKVLIGKILKAQGIRGEVKVATYLNEPKEFLGLKYVYLNGQKISVVAARVSGSAAYLKFATIADRNQAEQLRDMELYADREQLPLQDGEFLIDDLIGMEVFSEDGENIGKLVEILQNGRTDVFRLQSEHGYVMFPFLKKLLVQVDFASEKIIVKKEVFLQVCSYEN